MATSKTKITPKEMSTEHPKDTILESEEQAIQDNETIAKRLRTLENYVELRNLQIEELTQMLMENEKEIQTRSKAVDQLSKNSLKIKESLTKTGSTSSANPDNSRIREQLNFQAAEMNTVIDKLKKKRKEVESNRKHLQEAMSNMNTDQKPTHETLLMKDRVEVQLEGAGKFIKHINKWISDSETERETGQVTLCVFDGKSDSPDVARKKDQVCYRIKMKSSLIQRLKKDLFEAIRSVGVLETNLQKAMAENNSHENARIKGLLKSQIEEKQEQIKRIQNDLVNAKRDVDHTQHKLEKLESAYGQTEKSYRKSEALFEFNQRTEYHEQLKTRRHKAEVELLSIQSILEEANKDLFETQRKMNVLSLQVEETNEDISRTKHEIFEAEKELQVLHEQASKLNKQSVYQNRKFSTVKEKEKETLLEQEKNIARLQSRLEDLNKENEEIIRIKENLDKQIEEDKKEIDEIVKKPPIAKLFSSVSDGHKVKDILSLQIEQKNSQISNIQEELTDAEHDLESMSTILVETENSSKRNEANNVIVQKLLKQKDEKFNLVRSLKHKVLQLHSELEFVEITRMKEQVGFQLEQPLLKQIRHLKNNQNEAETELLSLRKTLSDLKRQSHSFDTVRLKEKVVILVNNKTHYIENIKDKRTEAENELDSLGISLMKDYSGLKLTKYLRSHIERLKELVDAVEKEIEPLKSFLSALESTEGAFRVSQIKEGVTLSIQVKERRIDDLKDSISEAQHDIESLEIILMKDQMCFQIMQRKRHVDRIKESRMEAESEMQQLKSRLREAGSQSEAAGRDSDRMLDQLSVQIKLMHDQRDRMTERLEEEEAEVSMYKDMLLKLSRKSVNCNVSFAKSFSAHFESYVEQMNTFVSQLSQKDEHINELKETVYDAKSNAEYYRNNMYQLAHESADIDSQLAVMTSRAQNAEKELRNLLLDDDDSDGAGPSGAV